MKYKVEVIADNKIIKDYFFDNLSHPTQAGKKVVESLKRSNLNYFIMLIANDSGEVWKYVARRDTTKKFKIRRMAKYGVIMNIDEIDMVFTNNLTIYGGIVR